MRIVLCLLLAAGCNRDRPLEGPDDAGPPDLAGLDLAQPDLWQPDLALPDLLLPDLFDRCPAGPSFVLVVDENHTLSRFRPDTLQFFPVGTLACPAQGQSAPFSMAVARDQKAYVLYDSGELFQVDSNTAACHATGYEPDQQGIHDFGMGFALDQMGSDKETLFVASSGMGGNQLATIDLTSFKLSVVAPITGNPELTSTPDTRLWGYFPDLAPPQVAQIDKHTGARSSIHPIPPAGNAQAWAFAAWGGDFWIFLWQSNEASTSVYRLRSSDGSFSRVLHDTGRHITGAGVSTCASGAGG